MKAGLIVCTAVLAVHAQVSFEAVSVKASPPPDEASHNWGCRGGPGTSDPILLDCVNMQVGAFLMRAYQLKRYQLSFPDRMSWIWDQFDITARIPASATKEQLRLMEQGLLVERFGLKLHHEQREMQIYELTVAKNGPKLKNSETETPEGIFAAGQWAAPASHSDGKDGFPVVPPGWSGTVVMRDRKMLSAPNTSMDDLAGTLSGQLGRPVVDATGLAGRYDIILKWMLDSVPDGPQGPSLERALQEQLGLKVESGKRRIDVLVIDHLERTPAAN